MVAGVFIASGMDFCFFSGKVLWVCVAGPEGWPAPVWTARTATTSNSLLRPLQLGRREIFTAPCHEGFRQRMTWKIYRPSVLLPDSCLGRGPMDGVWELAEGLSDTWHSNFGRSCLSLAAMTRGSGHLAYRSQTLGRDMEVCVSGTKPCPVRELCSWGDATTAVTAAFLISPYTIQSTTKAQKRLK